MGENLKGTRHGDLVVLHSYSVEGRHWTLTRCVRELAGGEVCGRERHVEAKRLRQTKACEECAGRARRQAGQGIRSVMHYRNGQPVVTLGGYKARLAAFTAQQRAEYERIVGRRRRSDFTIQEWAEVEREAVEIVVQQIGVKERRPAELGWSTNYRWLYSG